ncbi:MAG: hypothetical protein N3A02_04470 [Rectinema sp.]|nr:hypothetical protein [Rectinema sp.]
MSKRNEFPYSRQSAYFDLIIILIIVFSLMAMTVDIFGIGSWTFMVLCLVCLIFLIIFGISLLLTSHEIIDNSLILKKGVVFRAKISLANIEQITLVEKGPSRRGIFFSIVRPELFVTSSRYNLIRLKLRKKQRFFWALGKKAEVVFFDVVDTEKLIQILRDRVETIRANQSQEF